MRQIFLLTITGLFMTFLGLGSLMAQGTISGKILDSNSDEPMVGVRVILQGTARGALTNQSGDFSFEAEAGDYTIQMTYIGYLTEEKEITVTDGQTTKLGTIAFQEEAVGLDEVTILASLATDRKTPVAVSTIDGETVSRLTGNQEFPEIMRSTPSIYVTKQGGGFGDSRINVRGFDQRNTAVMINGIPVNDMENGWVYWSNWAGLSDVTSTIQVQRGLGASKLAVPSIGGSINIVTNPADFKKGGAAAFGIGNDGYQKYSVVGSTGLTESGFAATAQVTHSRGDGYVNGLEFRAFSYFLSLSQNIGDKHTIAITALGAPQTHHQRLYNRFGRVTLNHFVGEEANAHGLGIRYNDLAGTLDGEQFTFRKNFYHKPKVFVNHYFNISDKTSLKTSAYASYGWGGGTGPRGRISNSQSFFFDSFGGYGTNAHDAEGMTRYTDLRNYNQGQNIPDWGQKEVQDGGPFNGQYVGTSRGDGFIRRASMNYHSWYGVLSSLDHQLTDNLNLVLGVDARYYKGEHFRRLENLMGLDAYLSKADINNPENYITEASPVKFGNFYDNSYKKGNNVLNYWNDGLVSWLGLYGQIEYSNDVLTAFASFSGSNQGFKRIDYFNYLESDAERETEWVNKLGGTVKGGINYNINENMNIFVNGGMFSRQPIFDNVFLNFRNDINPSLVNQTVNAFEIGYGYRSSNFRANINLYHTMWGNRQFDEGVQVAVGDTIVDGLAVFTGVGQLHQGVELELIYNPISQLTLSGMLSVGNWRYTEDFSTTVTDTDNNQPLGTSTLYAEGLKVGDAAQTTANLRASFEVKKGINIYAQYYFADNLYADFNVNEGKFFEDDPQVAKLPSYSLVDAGAFVEVPLGDVVLIWSLNFNNILNTTYIAELETSDLSDVPTNDLGAMTDEQLDTFYGNNFGWFGFGRTWNTSLKVRF